MIARLFENVSPYSTRRMEPANHLAEIVLMLTAAVCIVALLRRAHISPVLGYLLAGVVIGPHGLALIRDVHTMNGVAEFGVVFLLFVIGLELSFERLARMRGRILYFGLLQMPLTALAIGFTVRLSGLSTAASLIIGGGLALSSTAIVLELLGESAERSTQTGRLSTATLILQDLAVIPLLVLVPLLTSNGSIVHALGEASLKAVAGLVGIMLLGRLLLRPFFHATAARSHHELFTAATLLVVLGLAQISAMAGLSPAMGAFMGGLLVSETEFRHQVEADILPFKGLLLGLFFFTVGMGVDLQLLMSEPVKLLCLTVALIGAKACIMVALCLVLSFPYGVALHSALLLSQGGEFALVLFGLAGDQHIITPYTRQMLISGVVLSMVATPLLHLIGRRLGGLAAHRDPTSPTVTASVNVRETMDLRGHVVIAGFGRVGRIIAQLLESERIPYVALDIDAANVGTMRERGKRVYYGDSTRSVVLKAVGLPRARAAIVSHSYTGAALKTIAAIRSLRPNIPIIARAHSIDEVMELEKAGATLALAEMFETSLQLGGALLKESGVTDTEIVRALAAFRASDYALARRAEGLELPEGTEHTDFAI